MTAYDSIGHGYATRRRADPRWQVRIHAALGTARTVVDVGSGTGNYEPRDRAVLAVEPSATMIAQRPAGSAPVIAAGAERLPLADGSFDAAMAILTVHHWADVPAGLAELRRVSRRQVVLTFDPATPFWLTDYVPEIAEFDRGRTPSVDRVAALLGGAEVTVLRVPRDMRDGVLAAHWCRPTAYLDPAVRACASGLAQLDPAVVERGVARLRDDLDSGTWHERYGQLAAQPEFDGGYRLLVAGG